MDILLLSFSYVAPFIVYLLLGIASKRLFSTSSKTYLDINMFVFKIFLPLSLFFNIYNSDFASVDFSDPLLISLIGTLLIFFLAIFFYGKRNLPKASKSVMIQNSFRSNFILFGIPLTQNIMGPTVSGLAGLMTALVIPLFNILSVIVLAFYYKEKVSFLKTILQILKNPLTIASLIAILLKYFELRIPGLLVDTLYPLGKIATPMALFALGGRFIFRTERSTIRLLLEGLLVRLFVVPLIAIFVSVSFGIRGEALALLLVLFGGPVAVTSYTMAQQMGGNEQLAAQLLVYTTVFSTFSLFVFISILKTYGFF